MCVCVILVRLYELKVEIAAAPPSPTTTNKAYNIIKVCNIRRTYRQRKETNLGSGIFFFSFVHSPDEIRKFELPNFSHLHLNVIYAFWQTSTVSRFDELISKKISFFYSGKFNCLICTLDKCYSNILNADARCELSGMHWIIFEWNYRMDGAYGLFGALSYTNCESHIDFFSWHV